jgi:hypothetical protein
MMEGTNHHGNSIIMVKTETWGLEWGENYSFYFNGVSKCTINLI